MFVLGQFKFQEFNTDIIKKVEEAAKKAGSSFEVESGNAQMTAKRVTKAGSLSFEVHDAERWDRVEEFVKDWMESKAGDYCQVGHLF
jgi:hypothetical protein